MLFKRHIHDTARIVKINDIARITKTVLQLPIKERWDLVQSVLASIQQETLSSIPLSATVEPLTNLEPWTQSLIGVIHLEQENTTETYVDYLCFLRPIKMTQQELLNEFLSLPAEAQRQVIDFIAFLRQRYAVVEPASQSPDFDLINDSFIGMWSDRQDLADSTAWVRGVRENEWSKSHD